MLTRAELRRIARTERRIAAVAPRAVRRAVNGRAPQRGWLPRRLTELSVDVDADAGVAAVWLVRRPRSAGAETHSVLLERYDGEWHCTGSGGSSSGDSGGERRGPGQVGMIDCDGGGSCVSAAHRRQHPRSEGPVPWIGYSRLRVAPGVDHLRVGGRRVEPPGHGRVVVVWTSPPGYARGRRLPIVALGPDGSELSRLGPHDSLDSRTWATLEDQ